MRRSRVRSPSAPFPEQAKAAAARRTLLFCFLVALCEGLDLQAAGVAAGGLSREFMPTPGQKGLFFSASTFGLSIGAVIGGWLADRIGRKKVLIAAIGAFGLFSLLTIFAWDMQSLTIARLLTGLGLGGALPNLVANAARGAGYVEGAGRRCADWFQSWRGGMRPVRRYAARYPAAARQHRCYVRNADASASGAREGTGAIRVRHLLDPAVGRECAG